MIFQSGAKIFSEFSDVRGNHRPMIVYSRIGTVVLERKEVEGGKCVFSCYRVWANKPSWYTNWYNAIKRQKHPIISGALCSSRSLSLA